jgi:hypothetical protein
MTPNVQHILTRVLLDVVVLVVAGAVFPVLYLTYRRTIRFKIKEVRERIQKDDKDDASSKEALQRQSRRLDKLATLKHEGYFAPVVYSIIVVTAGLLLALSKGALVPCSVGDILARCPWAPIAAFAGAYTFTLTDLIRRHRRMEMDADAIQRGWLRMLVAPVLATALTLVLKEELAVTASFALGVIPLSDVFSYVADRGRKTLGIENAAVTSQPANLGELQGIDKDLLERFMNEGIATVQQLALGDTFAIFVAVNVEWRTLLDYVDQAILHCFAGAALPELRKRGIRGAIEVAELSECLTGTDDPTTKANALALVRDLATVLKVSEVGVLNFIQTIASDGQVEFLQALWVDSFKVKGGDAEAGELPSALSIDLTIKSAS